MADVLPRQSASIAEDLYAHASVQRWTQLLVAAFDDVYAEQGASLTMRFRTSGSTGTPKSCPHRLDDLAQEMQTVATVLADGSRSIRRCVSTVRSHHIYGFLFTVLLPRLMELEHLLQSGDLVVSFPDWWWAAQRANARFPADVVGVRSTAPCPEDVALGMLEAGLQAFLHIYGSSETAGWGGVPPASARRVFSCMTSGNVCRMTQTNCYACEPMAAPAQWFCKTICSGCPMDASCPVRGGMPPLRSAGSMWTCSSCTERSDPHCPSMLRARLVTGLWTAAPDWQSHWSQNSHCAADRMFFSRPWGARSATRFCIHPPAF